jgi:dolichol kinase
MAARRRAAGRDAPSRAPEMAIVAFITLFAAWTLRETHAPEALALVGLGAGALAADALGAWSPAPDARPGVDASATLGLLSLPWTFAARTPDGMTPRDAFALWTCVTAGALMLARDVAILRRVVPDASRASVVVLAALACAAAASTRLMETNGASLKAHAALGACVLANAIPAVALAATLPSMFPNVMSRAEAALVAQSAALAAAAAAAAAAAVALERGTIPRVEWLPSHLYERHDDTSLLVLFGALAACGFFAAAPAPSEQFPRGARRRASGSRVSARASYRAHLSDRAFRFDARERLGAALLVAVLLWFEYVSRDARGDDAATRLARRLLSLERLSTFRTARLWATAFLGTVCVVARVPKNGKKSVPTVVLRKAYHVLAAAMFAPPLCGASERINGLVSRETLAAAYAVALAAFAALEVVRTRGASVRLPKALGGPVRVGQTIDALFEKFLDHRDAGGATVVLSHVSLLVAVAAPLWLTRGSLGAARHDAVATFGPFAGIIAVGIGDTCASVVGVRLGKTPAFRHSRKTAAGAFAGAAANAAASWALWRASAGDAVVWRAILPASLGAAWLETATEQSDNAFVPLAYLALLGCASRGSLSLK